MSIDSAVGFNELVSPSASDIGSRFECHPVMERLIAAERQGTGSVRATAYCRSKRAMDIVLASIGLLLLSPVFLIVAVLIKLTSRGPVSFVQTRVGRGGKEFNCYKFRSMVANAEEMQQELGAQNQHVDDRTFKMRRDPRVTTIGQCLRKTSIDELPQLLNVLKGEMSIVGPRPPLPREVARYQRHELRRLDVLPGLTCIWQVCGRGDVPFPKQVEMDIAYVEQQSLLLDLKLIAMTIPAVVCGKGAY
jgi:lipopolysaccharide/colanic/teichoic acid biosynthesis glycosyltransferase